MWRSHQHFHLFRGSGWLEMTNDTTKKYTYNYTYYMYVYMETKRSISKKIPIICTFHDTQLLYSKGNLWKHAQFLLSKLKLI